MIEKIIVVAPTTAVPMSTGFAVALKVFPAPSFSSRRCFARSNCTSKPKSRRTCSFTFGTASIIDSSYTDCALSVTGPYESTAIVTGPMPRNPNATRPKANTAGAIMSTPSPCVLTRYAMAMSPMIAIPSQNAEKLPATKPDKMLSDAPPCRDDVTTSFVCAECTEVKIFTNSGMIAPASVPQVIMVESFHQSVPSPSSGMSRYDDRYVSATETIDVSHTSEVSGVSKFIFSARPNRAFAIVSLMRYDAPLAITMTTRIMKIQTRSWTWTAAKFGPATSGVIPRRMNEMSATPVTP